MRAGNGIRAQTDLGDGHEPDGLSARTGTGTIVGVIGGYQQGGDTPAVSYSSYLGDAVHELYQQAVADESSAAG